jgi:hypothetical protein
MGDRQTVELGMTHDARAAARLAKPAARNGWPQAIPAEAQDGVTHGARLSSSGT